MINKHDIVAELALEKTLHYAKCKLELKNGNKKEITEEELIKEVISNEELKPNYEKIYGNYLISSFDEVGIPRQVKFVIADGAKLPVKHSKLAAGADLKIHNFKSIYDGLEKHEVTNVEEVILKPGQRLLAGTGLTVAHIPEDLELQIRSRSGISLKEGLVIANSPATIDADYRGEIGLILLNTNHKADVKVKIGDIVAQMVVAKAFDAEFFEVKEIEGENRGGGFGSTGK